jgi:hypothetical protein
MQCPIIPAQTVEGCTVCAAAQFFAVGGELNLRKGM